MSARMPVRALVASLGAVIMTGVLHAQGHAYEFPGSLSAETRITLTRIADSARAAGLPAEAIVAKAAEGALKGADDARIIRAARTLFGELTEARAALPPNTGVTALTAAASALHAGVPRVTLAQIAGAGATNESELAVGLVAAADLVANGVPPSRAGGAIVELLRRHAPESDITALRTAVAGDVARGTVPDSALGLRMQRLLKTLRPPK